MRIALVNTNRMKPAIGPIGLEYVAEALHAAGHGVNLLDLCWDEDIAGFFHGAEYGLVGVTLRNTDDCGYTSRQSFLGDFAEIIGSIRRHTGAPIVLGGCGFSVMPEHCLALADAGIGVCGDGEFVLPELAARLETGREWRELPNLIWRRGDTCRRNPAVSWPLAGLPPMSRAWADNRRYFRHGGQAGFETKRGCHMHCIYCADPVAKGRQIRTRPPEAVADELERLLDQGIDHLHTCDSEFNLPAWHAFQVCREIVRRSLGGRLRWYAYCSPVPFSRELAEAMHRAGCAGINFGVDSGDDEMLARLGRGFGSDDILNAARWSKEAGMAVMLDLLLGAPGETRESIARTVELVRQSGADCAGVSAGVRVYPGTRLAAQAPAAGGWFLEPAVAPFAFQWLDELIGGDRRFFFFDPSRPERNYNYNANQRLVDAIARGCRGAYWDILRLA